MLDTLHSGAEPTEKGPKNASAVPPAQATRTGSFCNRHIGPDDAAIREMLAALGYSDLEDLIRATIPEHLRASRPLDLPAPQNEFEALAELKSIAAQNRVQRSFIGMGYADCVTPPVIQRCILENPGWYTQYTPYQSEIAQGRLEALLNFQTLVADLTGLPVANASLLDEATAAAEAMAMCHAASGRSSNRFFVAKDCHPQTLAVVRTRAQPLGIEVIVADAQSCDFSQKLFAALLQYPSTDGVIRDLTAFTEKAHAAGTLVIAAADLLSLVLLRPPGEWGADVAIGSTQRFGVPLGFGGPHAAFFATRDAFKRQMPGRLVGVSKDAQGRPGYRLALQTREQHIRREKATSNICTAQVLLAVIASMYAVYHGPDGLRQIAERIHYLTRLLAAGLRWLGYSTTSSDFFDTLRVCTSPNLQSELLRSSEQASINLRAFDNGDIGISLDETTRLADLNLLFEVFRRGESPKLTTEAIAREVPEKSAIACSRVSPCLAHPVFHRYHSETEMLRYIYRLQARDLSLTTSMIPLGSCTMKLNAAAEMFPITWPEFARIHPFAPARQSEGYRTLFQQLEQWLAEITGFAAVSLQPNAGSQGEYAGLLAVRDYHAARSQAHRRICLIPASAHGTNPASAVMAGMQVVPVACDAAGNIDIADLRAKAEQHRGQLAALMVTYPSTHGVFEEGIQEICAVIHECGGQVYMDGANMNAQVGLCRPAELGADVCHLNLHKTFCIPHGGGGPGVGPICVAAHLKPFLPAHPLETSPRSGPVTAAPWGSASILPIPWMYIRMMGAEGLTRATQVAILNANYIAHRLAPHFNVLYKGKHGRVAHECILDFRPFKRVSVEDVAKRLMDFGFHAPTISWPVPGTIMIEPTESESKEELDRFCEALIAIAGEIHAVENGTVDAQNNPLKNAPHTAEVVMDDAWERPYSRRQAAFPAPWLRDHKFWPAVGRIDNVYGDRNLVCACPPVEAYQ